MKTVFLHTQRCKEVTGRKFSKCSEEHIVWGTYGGPPKHNLPFYGVNCPKSITVNQLLNVKLYKWESMHLKSNILSCPILLTMLINLLLCLMYKSSSTTGVNTYRIQHSMHSNKHFSLLSTNLLLFSTTFKETTSKMW